ncbi:MAG TPA: peptide chain release factor N(5)-glutamine methyltransferase [Candidatus Bathyarchaeia archaeon]|nr:peptide chain release factor N(5)-glutamine methyltransferase [Candidatus Bathyarchaeia archaeon]
MFSYQLHDLLAHISTQLHTLYKNNLLCHQYAWWILEYILKKKQAQLITYKTVILNNEQQKLLDEWLHKLVDNAMPLQYLLGSVPFDDVDILVQSPVLIPRPETEEWVADLIEKLVLCKTTDLTILDLACGSGCIALALAHHLPHATLYATDISPHAIALTEKNKQHNAIQNVTVLQSDLFSAIDPHIRFDLIVSNPPYISPEQWNSVEKSVTVWEDEHALVAQDHGMAIIKKIISQAPNRLKPHQHLLKVGIDQLYIEIDYTQGPAAQECMQKAGYLTITLHKDLEGKNRVISGTM